MCPSPLLTAGYRRPFVNRDVRRAGAGGAAHGEAPLTMVAPMVATAGLTVLMFVWADVPLAFALRLAGG